MELRLIRNLRLLILVQAVVLFSFTFARPAIDLDHSLALLNASLSVNASSPIPLYAGAKLPPNPYIMLLDGDYRYVKFFHYRRNFPSERSPMETEIQAFDYITKIIDAQSGRDSLIRTPPKQVKFKYQDAELSIMFFPQLTYLELSESLRTLGWFHLRFGYFEKYFSCHEPDGRILCHGQMIYTGSRATSE